MIERMMKKQTLPHMLLHGPPGTGAVWGEVPGLI
jgi:replication-associated recombination protein RarA